MRSSLFLTDLARCGACIRRGLLGPRFDRARDLASIALPVARVCFWRVGRVRVGGPGAHQC